MAARPRFRLERGWNEGRGDALVRVRQAKASSWPEGEAGAQRSLMIPSATQALS